MIVLSTLLKIRTYDDCYFPIFAASIDYSQRDEQSKEINFLKEYCEKNDVKLYISKVEGYSRKKENSAAARFDAPKNMAETIVAPERDTPGTIARH